MENDTVFMVLFKEHTGIVHVVVLFIMVSDITLPKPLGILATLSQIYHHRKRNEKVSENLKKAVLITYGFLCCVKGNWMDMSGNGKPN